MRFRFSHATLTLIFMLPIAAQQDSGTFHQFHRYPIPGQYTTKTEGSTNGRSGPPSTQTTCASASPEVAAAAAKARNQVNAMNECKVRILRDEERIVESEQTCSLGTRNQTIHITMNAIDDKTFTTDTVTRAANIEMTTHSTTHYDGPCTAAQAAAASTIPKPSTEECAELAASKKEQAETAKSCEQLPAENRERCKKQLQAGSVMVDQMLASCVK